MYTGSVRLPTALVTRHAQDLEPATVANRFIEMNRFSSPRHGVKDWLTAGNSPDDGKRDCKGKTFVNTCRERGPLSSVSFGVQSKQ